MGGWLVGEPGRDGQLALLRGAPGRHQGCAGARGEGKVVRVQISPSPLRWFSVCHTASRCTHLKRTTQVDEHLQTSDPDVFAAGDVAAFPLKMYGGEVTRQEHVANCRSACLLSFNIAIRIVWEGDERWGVHTPGTRGQLQVGWARHKAMCALDRSDRQTAYTLRRGTGAYAMKAAMQGIAGLEGYDYLVRSKLRYYQQQTANQSAGSPGDGQFG